jgi:putative flippase GtrA
MGGAAGDQTGIRAPFLVKYGRFLLVGLSGVAINLVVFAYSLDLISPSPTFNLIHDLLNSASTRGGNPVDYLAASAIAFAVATLWNFTFNNLWTFRAPNGHHHRFTHRLGLYYGVSLASLAVNEVVLFGLAFFVPPLIGQAIGIIGGSVVGFAGNMRVTFREAAIDTVPPGAAGHFDYP